MGVRITGQNGKTPGIVLLIAAIFVGLLFVPTYFGVGGCASKLTPNEKQINDVFKRNERFCPGDELNWWYAQACSSQTTAAIQKYADVPTSTAWCRPPCVDTNNRPVRIKKKMTTKEI